MTPAGLARLHAASFTVPRPWTEAEFAALLAAPEALLVAEPQGFALGRVIADEAELLTIAVSPPSRRLGLGRRLLDRFLTDGSARGAATVFLEVDEGNAAALRLYHAAGFTLAGRRCAYYHFPDGTRSDALVLRRTAGPKT